MTGNTHDMQLFTKQEILKLFDQFTRMRALVIGDVMVDAYLWGKVERISPEAPVPIVAVTKRNSRLGGAANVALNLKSLGAEVVLCSVAGLDHRGDELIQLMREEHLDTEGILQCPGRITTTKFRIFGNKMQMLRVDEESTSTLDAGDGRSFGELINRLITEQPWDVVIFQDYDKGLITPDLISLVCREATVKGIPVAVDPKRRNFREYKNVQLFKPNLKEFREGLSSEAHPANAKAFQQAVNELHQKQQISQVLITLSNDGIYISHQGEGTHLPAHLRKVSDVSGAGDTVISVAALGLAAGLTPVQMAALGNLAGGLVCEEVGVVPVNRIKLLRETIKHLSVH